MQQLLHLCIRDANARACVVTVVVVVVVLLVVVVGWWWLNGVGRECALGAQHHTGVP